jgi:hypothetical protein
MHDINVMLLILQQQDVIVQLPPAEIAALFLSKYRGKLVLGGETHCFPTVRVNEAHTSLQFAFRIIRIVLFDKQSSGPQNTLKISEEVGETGWGKRRG